MGPRTETEKSEAKGAKGLQGIEMGLAKGVTKVRISRPQVPQVLQVPRFADPHFSNTHWQPLHDVDKTLKISSIFFNAIFIEETVCIRMQ